MVGALSVVSTSVMESQSGPCLCLDALPSTNINLKRKHAPARPGSLELGSSFVDSWPDWRLSSKMVPRISNKTWRKQSKDSRLVVVNNLGGQYEDTFGDVKTQLLNYFTYKAVRTVLTQLYEMNPPKYTWFYQYVA